MRGAKRRFAATLCFAATLAGCDQEPLAVNGFPSDTLKVLVGQELTVTVLSVGGGEYKSPPAITSENNLPVLHFVNAVLACPCPPGGPVQRFRFRGLRVGVATVEFQHSVFERDRSVTVRVFGR